MEDHRRRLLELLLEQPSRAAEVRAALTAFAWDSEDQVLLCRRHVERVLDAFLCSALHPEEVEVWANAIEGRDDIGREVGAESVIDDAIHFLANPYLEGPLTEATAKHWIAKLAPS